MKTIRRLISLSSVVLLAGCAGMNGNFQCDKSAGDSCETMQTVNQKAEQGMYHRQQDSPGDSGTADVPTATAQQSLSLNPIGSGYPVPALAPGEPIRGGEAVQAIWIGPYQDKQGNYHEPSFVYTVVRPSQWIGLPPSAIQKEEDE